METKKRNKAVMYVRVSSREQEKGFSISAQLKYLKEYAQKNNLNVVKIFKEAESAKKAGRREFENMLEYLSTSDDVNIILVEKTDRLYRNIKDWTRIDFERNNLELHLAKEGDVLAKDSHSSKKLMHGIKVLMAKNYIDNMAEEVKKGLDEKLEAGILPGPAPMGYLNDRNTKTIVIDEKTSPYVTKAFELAATGNYSYSKLSKELYSMGLRGKRSGKALVKAQIVRILRNPFYYGEISRKGNIYPGKHKPLITKELFNKVQHTLGFVKRPSHCKYDFVFRGPLKCGHCGSHITAEEKRKKSGKTYTYYHCTNGKKNCTNVKYLSEIAIQEHYLKAFEKINIPQNIVDFTREALLESSKEERAYREHQITQLISQYAKLENRIDTCYKDRLDGIIELSEWGRLTKMFKDEQEEITNKIEALRDANTAYMMEGIKLMEIANSASKLFPEMNKEEKRELISLVLSNPVVKNASIEYKYKKPFDMFVKVDNLEKWRGIRDSNP